jgi:hypothetical protein
LTVSRFPMLASQGVPLMLTPTLLGSTHFTFTTFDKPWPPIHEFDV